MTKHAEISSAAVQASYTLTHRLVGTMWILVAITVYWRANSEASWSRKLRSIHVRSDGKHRYCSRHADPQKERSRRFSKAGRPQCCRAGRIWRGLYLCLGRIIVSGFSRYDSRVELMQVGLSCGVCSCGAVSSYCGKVDHHHHRQVFSLNSWSCAAHRTRCLPTKFVVGQTLHLKAYLTSVQSRAWCSSRRGCFSCHWK